jgi:uncharacterized protein
VMAFGRARKVEGRDAKRAAMDAFIDRLYAGRPVKLRPTTDAEIDRIALVEMEIEEASAKAKDSGATDLAEDAGWTAWSGVFPVETRIGAPRPEAGTGAITADLAPYAEGRRLEDALRDAAQGLPVST